MTLKFKLVIYGNVTLFCTISVKWW